MARVPRLRPLLTWDFELTLHPAESIRHVAGIDEAGRGCLAGPVHAAAVILPRGWTHRLLHDSKLLDPAERNELAAYLRAHPEIVWAVGVATVQEIDTHNILQATFLAMIRAVENLPTAPHHCLLDGNARPTSFRWPLRTVVDGDALCPSIAAASILAKTARDAHMAELSALYPPYGFAKHKGYSTAEHQRALTLHGPCPIHRQSFRPVRLAAGTESGDGGADRLLWGASGREFSLSPLRVPASDQEL